MYGTANKENTIIGYNISVEAMECFNLDYGGWKIYKIGFYTIKNTLIIYVYIYLREHTLNAITVRCSESTL